MNLDKMLTILRTIAVLNALQGEEGSYRLGDICKWSRIPRATVDRYLRKMVDMGVLLQGRALYRGEVCRVFELSKDGKELVQVYQV